MITFLTWLANNWKGLVFGIAISFLLWFLNSLHTDLRTAELASQKWENAYKQTAENLAIAQASYLNLKTEHDKLEKRLVQREAEMKQISSSLASIRGQITKLGSQNESIHRLLVTVVPDELWEQIFPARHTDGNQDRKN